MRKRDRNWTRRREKEIDRERAGAGGCKSMRKKSTLALAITYIHPSQSSSLPDFFLFSFFFRSHFYFSFHRVTPSIGSSLIERPYFAFVTVIDRGCIITYGNDDEL